MRISGIGAWSGGTVVDLAVSGDTVLAATFAGIYRSTDGGHTWHPVGANLPDWFVQAVALAPLGAQTMALAASHMGWLYRSMDDGETWETLSYWNNIGIATRLAVSPAFETDGVVFACTEENGIWKSTDRASNWKQGNFGLLNLSVADLCFSPDFARDEVVFACTDGGGLFRSRNAGRAWRESGEGIPDSAVQCLGISPGFSTDGVILAGTEERGIYRSQDGGHTWSPLGEALAEACVNGLYLSPDWATGSSIVAATDDGLLVSADGGHTWREALGGLDYPYVVAPCGDGLLAGAYEEGVYRSDAGGAWHASNGDMAAHLPPVVCFSDGFEHDGTVLMASMEGTLVRSTDAGQTWETLFEEDEVGVSAFAGSGAGGSISVLAASESRLLCSRDSGASWADVLNTGQDALSALAISVNYARDRTMLAGTAGGQVFGSRDDGASWRHVGITNEMIVTLAARTGSAGLAAYAVTASQAENGTWQLALRKGGSWQALLTRETSEPVAALCLLDGDALLCSMGNQVLYLDADEVVSESELEGSASVSCLDAAGDTLMAGSRLGLYRSTDRAQTWQELTRDISVVALRVVGPDSVYAVSMGGRLWQIDLS